MRAYLNEEITMDTDRYDPIELDLMHDPSDAQIAYLAGAYAPIVARLDCPGTRARLHAKTVAIVTGRHRQHEDGCPAPVATTGTDTPWDNCTCQPPSDEPDPEDPPDTRCSFCYRTERCTNPLCSFRPGTPPEPDAMLVEARFTLETARENIAHVRNRLTSDGSSAMTLDLALAQITKAMGALP